MTTSTKGLFLDRAAIGLSILCLIHCLALPLLLVLIPAIAVLPFTDEWFHLALVLLVLPISTVALVRGYQQHRHSSVLFWGGSGVLVLVLAVLFGHDLAGEAGETAATVVGAIIVALAHLRNYRLCRAPGPAR